MPPSGALPGFALPNFSFPGFGPVASQIQPVPGPVFTIANPPAPPPQQFTNIATLLQADIAGVLLFLRFAARPGTGSAGLPGSALPGGAFPGFAPTTSPATSILLVEGADYRRVGSVITLATVPAPGTTLFAQVFTKGLQLGGATAKRYVAPIQFPVAGSGVNYQIQVGPTIFGVVDGTNKLFILGAVYQRWQIWRNGILQTFNVDVVAGPTAIVFLPGAIPQPADIITALGFNNC